MPGMSRPPTTMIFTTQRMTNKQTNKIDRVSNQKKEESNIVLATAST
jgi:hypothetical protein